MPYSQNLDDQPDDPELAAIMAEINAWEAADSAGFAAEVRKLDGWRSASTTDVEASNINGLTPTGADAHDRTPLVCVSPLSSPLRTPSQTPRRADRNTSTSLPLSSSPTTGTRIKSGLDAFWKKRGEKAEKRSRHRATPISDWQEGDHDVATMQRPSRWKDADETQRLDFYSIAVIETGSAVAFTLNFEPALAAQACKEKLGPLNFLRRIVMRRLQSALGTTPDLVVALDFSSNGRPHLHGLVSWPGDLRQLQAALKLAGGPWQSRHGERHQVMLQSARGELIGDDFFDVPCRIDTGWLRYSCKSAKHTRSLTGRSEIYASNGLKHRAREFYDAEIDRLRKASQSR